MRRSLRGRTVTWMSAGFATILVMTAIALGAFIYQRRGIEAVRYTVAVDGRLARVLSAVQDAETGQRGYLLTGDEAFLLPFTEGRQNVDRQLDRLRDLVRDDADQRAELDVLSGLIREPLDGLDASVALSRGGDGAAARASVAQGWGKPVMDAICDLVRRMEAHEADRMERRQAAVSRVALAIWILVGALTVPFVLFALSALREASRRSRLSRFLPRELVLRLADDDALALVAVIARWTVKAGQGEPVRIGVGVHYGAVFCGIIGEAARYEFTVLGDAVNVAARLEQAAEAHGVPLLISEAARRAAQAPPEARREVSREPLRGRREAMPDFTVAAPPPGRPARPGGDPVQEENARRSALRTEA